MNNSTKRTRYTLKSVFILAIAHIQVYSILHSRTIVSQKLSANRDKYPRPPGAKSLSAILSFLGNFWGLFRGFWHEPPNFQEIYLDGHASSPPHLHPIAPLLSLVVAFTSFFETEQRWRLQR